MILCVDCQYYKLIGTLARCTAIGGIPDLVSGNPFYPSCAGTRYDERSCGQAARWFQPRDEGSDSELVSVLARP